MSGDWPREKTGEAGARLVLGLRRAQGYLWSTRDRHGLATLACFETAGAGLAGISRGFSRPAPIAIWSCKIARLDSGEEY
jgi:hypothetical protein